MKITTKLTLAAIAVLLTIASPAFANGLVGETSDYWIYSYQIGNSQPAIFYVRKEPSIALSVQGAAGGFASHAGTNVQRQNGRGPFHVSIPGSIN